MRVTFLTLFLLFILSHNTQGQELDRWQVGLNAAPFYFGRYNGHEYTTRTAGTIPFGYAAGITIEKNWNPKWGIKTGFEFSEQKRKEFQTLNLDGAMEFKFTYFKIPLSLQYSIPITNRKDIYLIFSQGVQFSFLDDFRFILGDPDSVELGYIVHSPNERNHYNKDGELESKFATDWFVFEKKLIGLVGGAGIKKFLSNNFSVSANFRYELDLTNADANPLFRIDLNDEPNWKPKTTHHYRLGFEFGFQYHFDKKQRVYVEGIL